MFLLVIGMSSIIGSGIGIFLYLCFFTSGNSMNIVFTWNNWSTAIVCVTLFSMYCFDRFCAFSLKYLATEPRR